MKTTTMKTLEYIWLDGAAPMQQPRSKTRFLALPNGTPDPASLPKWSFDGSSTYQADGGDSDLILAPVCVVPDPIRGEGAYLVLCEVEYADGTPHGTNRRAALRAALAAGAEEHEPWFGIEQEYTLFAGRDPLGFPEGGYPRPQGPFYCGVGSDQIFGRELSEKHARACLAAGLMIYGTNAEVMPGQWEFQIGYRGVRDEDAGPLTVSDHLWLARWLLERIAEDMGITVSLDPKPVSGDWNGAGAHTNFSTAATRDPVHGMAAIRSAVERLSRAHTRHIRDYGHGLERRLTGRHETCSIERFATGVADRGASIRIPRPVSEAGCGYLEDRRPGANCDPYVVCLRLIETVCLGVGSEVGEVVSI
jgi:glutamine synthetase